MAKYIDADALMEYLKQNWEPINDSFPMSFSLNQIKDSLDEMPAADVKPTRHGEWIKLDVHSDMEQYKCSACDSAVYVPEGMGEPLYSYCPVCGSKMDGGSE